MENTYKKMLTDGSFTLGVNYWASHAGTNMWHDWDEGIVDDDLKRLSESGIRLLRIFPLWPDFQPIKMLYGGGGSEREIRYENEQPLPFTDEGRAGVDPVMAERFGCFCRIAQKYGIGLIIGLITGWMSGRLYVPRLFERVNVLTDSRAIKWEVRFVQYMVRRFSGEQSIIAWELGNECNCMGGANRDQAYLWAKTITMAVKELDSSRPMISGMHGLVPDNGFNPEDQGEIEDFLTTHPYPLFTPYCNTDPMTKMKSALHASAESVMYAGLGGKPCFVEEAGVLGPMMLSDDNAARYLTASAMTAWAHGLRSFIWWCANEQAHLTHPPYDWNAVERELGVFDGEKRPKPILGAMSRLQKYADEFPYSMSEPITDAVCVLSRGQDVWAAAYGTFLLAKQSGIDVRYCYVDDEIPDAKVYLLPSVAGDSSISRHTLCALLDKVNSGATLYLSLGDALMSPFESFTGLHAEYRMRQPHTDAVTIEGADEIKLSSPITLTLTPTTAEVIASTADGNPALTRNKLGKGVVWYLNYPLEHYAAVTPNAIYEPLNKIYRAMKLTNPEKTASKTDEYSGLTEHIVDSGRRVLVLINYENSRRTISVTLGEGWRPSGFKALDDSSLVSFDGRDAVLDMAPNSGASIIISRV